MTFSGKVWSDHGCTRDDLITFLVNSEKLRDASMLISYTGAWFVLRTTACLFVFLIHKR